MSLNNKQQLFCQMATTALLPQKTKDRETARKW